MKEAERQQKWVESIKIKPINSPLKPSAVVYKSQDVLNQQPEEENKAIQLEAPKESEKLLSIDELYNLYNKNYKFLSVEEKIIVQHNLKELASLSED